MNKLSIDFIGKGEIKGITKKSLRFVIGGTGTRPSLSEIVITKEEEELPAEK
ncbi:hypothetical protein [Aquimarina aggregata]|uniref:hypothetical protein n=1 Tax=Aquimarina aggregata TaxID=1642818 RepID=UPI000A582E44|nr:hypothetical protein [Aquimarina aggregata]